MTRGSNNLKRSAAAVAAVAMIAGGAHVATAAVPGAPPSVLVFNQTPAGKAISIDYANLPVDGYVVVYASDGEGKRTGEPLGSAALKAGSHQDVKVELSAAPAKGAALWASLYKDKDGKQGFDAAGDKPMWTKLPMQNAFTIQ